ncbi:uncharacterized protein LOC128234703 [Mya arenaria]|uniref:uncharacterized protein LOC128234703 n=1 Tax=Mya arenaria TaxID=6604 RepID=UPI0022DF83C5|nr:uncharacterized protein LOC128234703 [Mya arenaria]
MIPQWITKGVQFAVRVTVMFGYICLARNQFGTTSVVGPAFVNREVTLKVTPFYRWGCDVEWKYRMKGVTQFQTLNGPGVEIYSEDGSFFLKLETFIEYNGSYFYAGCSTNATIRSSLISLNVKEIVGLCGALVILSPVVRGADVKLGYFPSDYSLRHQLSTRRTWKRNVDEIWFREDSYEEKIISEYLYILTIFNFKKRHEGMYMLYCKSGATTDFVHLLIPEPPSYPIIGPKSADYNTTGCIYVYGDSDLYCQTENGTEPVQVALLLGRDSFSLAESEQNKGVYIFSNVHQQMAGLARRNVTCQVSNAAIETPYEVHGILCNVEKGSPAVLTVPEFLDGESSTTICEVRNALPAPVIEIRVSNVLLSDVQQTDLFNGSSHTYTSTAKVTTTNKLWNGEEMCCTRKTIHDFGIADHSICKNISIKCGPTLYLNATSPVDLHPNITVIVKCFVDDCNAIGKWKLRWEGENNTEIKTCRQTEECLLTLNYTGDGEKTYVCRAWNSEEFLRNLLTVIDTMPEEATTNPALVVSQRWHTSALFAVSGTVIGVLATTFTVLLCRRCKPHVYEMLIRLRRPTARERSTHVYDVVQSNIETNALYNLTRVSASATGNKHEPSLLDMEGNIGNPYDYVDTPLAQSDRRTNAPDANYIHAI